MTRRFHSFYGKELSVKLFLNLVYCILYCCNCAGFLIRDLDSEYFLKLHKKLYGVKRISTQVVCEIGGLCYLRLFYAQFVNDDGFNFFYDILVLHNDYNLSY